MFCIILHKTKHVNEVFILQIISLIVKENSNFQVRTLKLLEYLKLINFYITRSVYIYDVILLTNVNEVLEFWSSYFRLSWYIAVISFLFSAPRKGKFWAVLTKIRRLFLQNGFLPICKNDLNTKAYILKIYLTLHGDIPYRLTFHTHTHIRIYIYIYKIMTVG